MKEVCVWQLLSHNLFRKVEGGICIIGRLLFHILLRAALENQACEDLNLEVVLLLFLYTFSCLPDVCSLHVGYCVDGTGSSFSQKLTHKPKCRV